MLHKAHFERDAWENWAGGPAIGRGDLVPPSLPPSPHGHIDCCQEHRLRQPRCQALSPQPCGCCEGGQEKQLCPLGLHPQPGCSLGPIAALLPAVVDKQPALGCAPKVGLLSFQGWRQREGGCTWAFCVTQAKGMGL